MESNINIFEYISSVFEIQSQGNKSANGDYRIEMADNNPKYLIVHLYYDKDKETVEISINGIVMGILKPYSGQGYRYKFEQRYRVGIRNGRMSAEQFMEDVCNGDGLILLQRAYH